MAKPGPKKLGWGPNLTSPSLSYISGELVANTPMSSIASQGFSFLIPIAVIAIVIIAVFVVILWFRGRIRSHEGQEMLLEEMDEDVFHHGSENGNQATGRNQMGD